MYHFPTRPSPLVFLHVHAQTSIVTPIPVLWSPVFFARFHPCTIDFSCRDYFYSSRSFLHPPTLVRSFSSHRFFHPFHSSPLTPPPHPLHPCRHLSVLFTYNINKHKTSHQIVLHAYPFASLPFPQSRIVIPFAFHPHSLSFLPPLSITQYCASDTRSYITP